MRSGAEIAAVACQAVISVLTSGGVLLTLAAAPLRAQQTAALAELRGRVVLAGDSAVPVVAADVELALPGQSVATDRDGRFRLSNLPPGTFQLQVRRLGYEPLTRAIVLEAGKTNSIIIELRRVAAELSEIAVDGRRIRVPPRFGAIYERAARSGKLFTRDDIQQQNPSDLKTLLGTLPGVLVNDRGLTFQRCQAGLQGLHANILDAQSSPGPGSKRRPGFVQVYVDGHRVTWTTDDQSAEADADRVLSRIHPSSVEAMEVYTGVARLPADFMSDACAAIVIWTRSY